MLVANLEYLESSNGRKNTNSIKSDFIDNEIYKDAIKDAKSLKEKMDERNEETPFFNKLGQDIFNSLYKVRPQMYSKDDVVNSLKMEHDIMSELTSNTSFNKLRRNTACDLFNSTYGLNMFQEQAYTIVQNWIAESKENKEMMDKLNSALGKQQTLDNLLGQLEDDPGNEDLQLQIDALQDLINNENEALGGDSSQQPNINNLKNQLGSLTQNVQKEVQQAEDDFNNYFTCPGAGKGEGQLQATSYQDRLKLSKMLQENSKLKEISKELGRMREIIGKINKKPSKIGHVIADVGLGNNIGKCLASEKLLLSEPVLENQFYKKYLNKSLMQYDVKGVQEMKGPIIVCVDDSGSMRGTRDYWAKAIALAMLQLAVKQNRNYRCIIFSDKVDTVFDFNKKNFNPEEVIKLASFFSGGGTEFEPALKKAVESIEDSRYKKADILFITDGDPFNYLTEDFKKKLKSLKEEKEFVVQGIVIGKNSNKYMDEFCDTVTTFKDLNKDNELLNIFTNVKNTESGE